MHVHKYCSQDPCCFYVNRARMSIATATRTVEGPRHLFQSQEIFPTAYRPKIAKSTKEWTKNTLAQYKCHKEFETRSVNIYCHIFDKNNCPIIISDVDQYHLWPDI
jgi:hypothetical protein